MSCNLQTQGKHINFDEKTQGKMGENHQKLRENDVEDSVRTLLSIVVEEGICPKKNFQHGDKPVENVRRGVILPVYVDLDQVRRGRIPDGRNLGTKELKTREQSVWFMVKIQMIQTVVMVILMSLSM